ncbi:MAG: RDD family protein [Planctomycetes bacterium]|nr:RDD family protein [Planctomycetota bacterium]
METEQRRRAGFWVKSCAQLIDLALVAMAVILVAEAVAGWGLYVPIEITAVVVYLVYAGTGIGSKGQTLGQAALGLRVTRRDGGRVAWVRAFARVGTAVTRPPRLNARHRLAFAAVMIVIGACIAVFALGKYRLYRAHRAWIADADAAANRTSSATNDAIEVASLNAAQRGQMAAWLSEHGGDPARTVIDFASTHQVTIIGEMHHKKAYLDFFNEIIPDLYTKAGVRVLALEWCLADQDKDLAHLVESRQFDRELLKAVARRAPWQTWGDKEYWDVLETVWRVNQSRPQGSEPLRVVGISPGLDGASWTLVREGAWYEKLRIVRVIALSRTVFLADAYYARPVEREAFDRGRRTVVWVGAAHAPLGPTREIRNRDGTVKRIHRMGSMLFGRYGTAVGQAVLHCRTETDRVARLIEESAQQSARTRVAFTVADSPFATLRDGEVYEYQSKPGRGLAALASHYLMLMPEKELRECDWMEGFLSCRMLGRNRPYYELMAGGSIDDVNDPRIAAGARRL